MKITKKKILKLFLYLAGLFLLFLLGLFLTLQYFFPSSFLKGQIESYIMDNYGISIKINDLDFSLLSGIEISDFSIKDNDIPDSLFSFDSFQLEYDLLPLMDKKLIINKLTVEHPRIIIIKDENGRFNFDGIIEKFANDQKITEEPAKEEDKGEPSFAINLENLEINNIEVLYEDKSKEAPMEVDLPRYNVKLRDVHFKSIDEMKVDLSISTTENNSLIFSDKVNNVNVRQEIKLDVNVVNENIKVKIDHRLSDITFKNKDIKVENIGDNNIHIEADYNLKTDSLNIDKLNISLADMISAELLGNISNVSSSQVVDIALSKLEIDLEKALEVVKENDLAELPPVALTDTKFLIKDLSLYHEVGTGKTCIKGNSNFKSSKISYREKDIFAVISDLSTKVDFRLGLDIKSMKLKENKISLKSQIGSISANIQGQKYRIKNIITKITPVLNKDLKPQNIKIYSKIGEILNGNISLQSELDFSNVNDYSIENLIKNMILKLKIKAFDLALHEAIPQSPKGLIVSFREDINFKDSKLKNHFTFYTEFKQIDEKDSLFLPMDKMEVNTSFTADLSKYVDEMVVLDTLYTRLDSFNKTTMSDVKVDLNNSIVHIGNFTTELKLDHMLYLAKQTKLPIIQNTSIDEGQFEINAQGMFNYAEMSGSGTADISMLIENLSHDDIVIKDHLKINEKIIANENNISLVGGINISDFDMDGLLQSYDIKGNINLQNSITYGKDGKIRINKFRIELPDIQTSASLTGKADVSTKVPTFNLELQHNIGLRNEYPVVSQLKNIKGFISGTTKISGDTNYVYVINHTEGIKGFNAKVNLDSAGTQYAQINNMNIQFPFNFTLKLPEYDMAKAEFIPMNSYDDDFSFLEYSENRDTYAKYGLPVSTITADEIEINHPMLKDKMKNLDIDMYYDDNKLTINRYYFELLDGNATGFLKLDLGKGKLDDSITKRANLDLSFMASGMNTYYLANKENSEEASTELNITMALNSQGLDILNNPNLNGEISISKISSGDAKYLLDFLNKSSGDQTAGMVKNMLNLFPGIKVDLFSFKIKNNFLYTLIKLKKPWYLFYFPLADEIKLSKQSLKFYIDKYVIEE
ncbi:MAG: AsmA family protein [Candidatus Delongbacteria bacterium]|nr:AsmA family protein [Candidatus Delongbacteria bacterium]